ncbi:MAG: secondary thiamine-phosphate synthase enzyme YjbQ [Acidobacteria bacterium]|nr:secondary thiamine-phosphate synthase enzyme YjbQ [Acidobacteriota bacterium]
MSLPLTEDPERCGFVVAHRFLRLHTAARTEFIDLTPHVCRLVHEAGLDEGLVTVQTQHTTTAIVANEAEPLLHGDVEGLLERWAPRAGGYRHDRNDLRTVNVVPGERPNADAHARAMLLGASESFAVVDGRIALGRWQRIFLVELDGPRLRKIAVALAGHGGARP